MGNKASEVALGELHGAVARVLTEQITHKEEETRITDDGEVESTGQEVYTASPATIAAAIKFLKDNQITCDVEQEENMSNLKDALAKKQKRSSQVWFSRIRKQIR
jgi:hypothetical protein